MFLCAPWDEYYLHNLINPPNLNHQNVITFLSTTLMCAQKQFNTLSKWTFSVFYKSMHVEWQSNQLEVPPKNLKGLTQWSFVPLGPAIIYTSWIITTNLYHQILMALILTTVMCVHQKHLRLSWNELSPMIFLNQFLWINPLIPLLKRI